MLPRDRRRGMRLLPLALGLLLAGCLAPAPHAASDACADALRTDERPRAEEGGGGHRTLGRLDAPEGVEKPLMLLTNGAEWLDFCRRSLEAPTATLDLEREDVLVVHGYCVYGVSRLVEAQVTEVYVRSCPGRSHVVAIARDPGELRLVDLDERFVAPHEPPTRDPPTPYTFDPDLAVHLARDADGVLRPVDGGHGYVDGEWRAMPPPPQAPLPACEEQAPVASAADADEDKVRDDLEALLAAEGKGGRVSAIVAMRCPISWNDVLALREAVGVFPVDAVWSTGAMAFAAELSYAQVYALAQREDVRVIEGNGRVSLA